VPIIDDIIRETLRLVKNNSALRRNLGDNFQIGEKTIDKGTFVVYDMADVHLNEKFYPEPLKFDPGRYSAPREEDKRGNMIFLAWGAGRHPCSGMKFAKLEIKMILALFLSRYEYDLVDGSGNFPKQSPQPDWNDLLQVRQ
jgi:cytochrome P450